MTALSAKPGVSKAPAWLKPVVWALSLALIAGAAFIAFRQRESAATVWDHLRLASPWSIALLLLLPLVSTALTAAAFWQSTRRHGKVSPAEMFALIGSSWVLNLLPLKPGLIGRVGYHARYNRLTVPQCILILIEVSAAGFIGVGAACVLALSLHEGSLARHAVTSAVWLCLFAGAVIGAVRPHHRAASILATSFIRALDACAWAVRYWLILKLLGVQASLLDATLISAAAQAAMYVPLVGNGLGVREWAVGAAAAASQSTGPLSRDVFTRSMPAGLSIDLVNRVAELLVLVPLGLVCCAWVARLVRRHEANLSVPPRSG